MILISSPRIGSAWPGQGIDISRTLSSFSLKLKINLICLYKMSMYIPLLFSYFYRNVSVTKLIGKVFLLENSATVVY